MDPAGTLIEAAEVSKYNYHARSEREKPRDTYVIVSGSPTIRRELDENTMGISMATSNYVNLHEPP